MKKTEYASVRNPVDLAINEIESVYELVVEVMFDEDVPESKEDEIDASSSGFELYFFNANWIQLSPIEFSLKYFPHYTTDFLIVHQEPLFQPPKHA